MEEENAALREELDESRAAAATLRLEVRGVNLYITLGGQILRKLGKVQAPNAQSCGYRRQEVPHD